MVSRPTSPAPQPAGPPPHTRRLDAVPPLAPLYARAVLPRRGGGPLPRRELVVRARADDRRLRRYAQVCGFARGGPLPLTYPHLVAFPLAVALMTRRDFPHPLLGLVHVGNRVERLRPLRPDETLTYRVRTGEAVPHPRGTAFEMVAEASDGDGPVWRSASTYLRRGPATGEREAAASAREEHRAGEGQHGGRTERWEVPAATGRAYAAVSGDRNPIHLHPLTARAFGFPRAIAHGMWTKARCLAALEGELPDACRAEVAFRAPVLLPAPVVFTSAGDADGGLEFALRSADGGREHLRGRVSPTS
ncbi:MaoC/PaaZ C-terminal domain-containing protein [Streptomyces sp. TRM 70351]|uniref:MaoC family dehydratase n=1 Tax=Streptomyces sp. TRM 70351 TaxID=3116552 RepID=UPI002E7B0414|nr:MaoC/PaaZ C-terminal domain-containing protein [Streptomyces sp. TRM 70351]MEE1927066.1 MaoC/PaaZ C-terminal domain-containing protein [Streptomyces sp. TRM 70351]